MSRWLSLGVRKSFGVRKEKGQAVECLLYIDVVRVPELE